MKKHIKVEHKDYCCPEIIYSGAITVMNPIALSTQNTPELSDENMEWDS